MGLLAKTNPTATRKSVIRQAWIWGAVCFLACLAYFLWNKPSFNWPYLLPVAAIAGAAIGALMEWQLDDVGIDLYYVVKEVEDEFGVEIPDWETIETVDDLYRRALTHRSDAGNLAVDDDEIWRRLQELLVRQLGFKPEKVVLRRGSTLICRCKTDETLS